VRTETGDLGVRVTTDPAGIARFLAGDGHRVVFWTYQSSPQIAAAFRAAVLEPLDLAICDESHWRPGCSTVRTRRSCTTTRSRPIGDCS
jgi:predicted helicase